MRIDGFEFCFKVYSLGFFELTVACKKRELNLMTAEKSSKSTNSLFENKQVQNSWMPGFRNKNCWKNMHSFLVGPKTLRHAKLRLLSRFFEGYAKKKKTRKNFDFAYLSVLGPTKNECMFFQQFLLLKPGIHEFEHVCFRKANSCFLSFFSAAIKFNSCFLTS